MVRGFGYPGFEVWLLFLFWTCAERLSAVRLVFFVANCLLYDTCYVFGNAIVSHACNCAHYNLRITVRFGPLLQEIIDLRLCEGGLVVWYSGDSGQVGSFSQSRFSSALKVLIAMI